MESSWSLLFYGGSQTNLTLWKVQDYSILGKMKDFWKIPAVDDMFCKMSQNSANFYLRELSDGSFWSLIWRWWRWFIQHQTGNPACCQAIHCTSSTELFLSMAGVGLLDRILLEYWIVHSVTVRQNKTYTLVTPPKIQSYWDSLG